jgi:glycosyltransferase involved in cell wall biosynthesis
MIASPKHLISIIVPVYNVALYLRTCVDSIVRQLADCVEVLLVDDGSTDESSEICDAYAERFENIKVIHKENGGLSDARNAGIRASSGKWLLFIDGDDCIEEHSLSVILDIAKEDRHEDLVFLQISKVFSDGHKEDIGENMEREKLKGASKENALDYLTSLPKFPGSACAKLIRRAVLIQNEHCFEKGLLSEDIDFMMGLMLYCSRFDYCPQEYYRYRQNRIGSITYKANMENLHSLLGIVKKWVKLAQSDHKEYSKYIYAFMAYEYAVLLGVFGLATKAAPDGKQRLWLEIQNLEFLLKYARSSRAKMLAIMCRVMGLKFTAWAATKYLQWR